MALRFASDDELGALLRAQRRREPAAAGPSSKSIKNWRRRSITEPNHSTASAARVEHEEKARNPAFDRSARTDARDLPRVRPNGSRPRLGDQARQPRPIAEALRQTIDESERVLADLGRIEIAIAEMKAALW